MPGIYQNLDFNSTVYKMLKNWGFSPCLIIYLQQRYWECGIRGALAVLQWTIPQKKKNRVGVRGLRTYFFENPYEFSGFCFTPKFQTN